MTQSERLDFLIEAFKREASEYAGMKTPSDPAMKRRLLRSLMNVRPPGPLSEEVLKIQDAYLSARAAEAGRVGLDAIPTIRDAYGGANPFADVLSVWQGDITRLSIDAIVNAANSAMLGCFVPCHGCIDNAIHTFAGVQLREACERKMEALKALYGEEYTQPTAVPMITDGYNLPAKKVIHVVGPIVREELTAADEQALAACYRNTLDLCAAEGLRGVAFCCLSTGVFRFPKRRAAEIAVSSAVGWLAENPGRMGRVVFNVFQDEDRGYYEEILS